MSFAVEQSDVIGSWAEAFSKWAICWSLIQKNDGYYRAICTLCGIQSTMCSATGTVWKQPLLAKLSILFSTWDTSMTLYSGDEHDNEDNDDDE